MATAASIFSADQFRCSVCLEVFTDPVSTPCGHNFCRACMAASGDHGDQCPVCRETLDPGQRLCVNAGLRDLAELFKAARTGEGSPSPSAKPGEVPCDFCLGTKLKAHKSCLVCLASYCHVHLEPHGRVQALKRHRLISPVGNLEDRVCWKHDVSVEFFCRTDQTRICATCLRDGHVAHETVSFKEELVSRKAQLYDIDAEVKRKLQRKLLQVEEVKRAVTNSWNESESVKEAMVKAFSALVASIKASQAELVSAVECRQRSLEGKGRDFIADLELDMAELRRRIVEIEQLSNTEDDFLLLLQNPSPPTMHTPSPPKEMPGVFLHPDQIMSTVMLAITQQKDTFRKNMKRVAQEIKSSGTEAIKEAEKEMKLAAQDIKSSGTEAIKEAEKEMKLAAQEIKSSGADVGKKAGKEMKMVAQEIKSSGTYVGKKAGKEMKMVPQEIKSSGTYVGKKAEKEVKMCLGKKTEQLFEDQLMKIQELYSVDVTLDPDTANPFLVVTKDGKQVNDGGLQRYFSCHQKRFKVFKYVAGKKGFSSNLYYEASVNGLMYWDLGVVSESIIGNEQYLRASQKSWSVCLIQGFYYANTNPPTNIRLTQKPQKIGVFVDYKASQVSVYDVDNRTLIYSFTGCLFKQDRLVPLIGISKTADKMFSSPLTISPVNPGTKR